MGWLSPAAAPTPLGLAAGYLPVSLRDRARGPGKYESPDLPARSWGAEGKCRLVRFLDSGTDPPADPAGDHVRRTNDPFVVAFAVDSRNQLASASASGNLTVAGSTSGSASNVSVNGAAATVYSDGTFARTNVAPTGSLVAIATDAAGRTDTNSLSAWYPGSTTFAHDANGNLISDGRRAISWDPENRLVEVLVTNAWKSGLLYDGLGRMRVRTEANWNGSAWATNATTRYLYDGLLIVEERDGANNPRLAYTRGRDLSGSRSGAGGIGGLLALTRYDTPSPAHAWYHADGSGNVTALVNAGQFLVARYLYDPYGALLAQTGGWSDLNRLRFSSKEHLTSSGLYAFGRRFLAPELGRWLNRDPPGESGGLNLYGFVGNSPVNWLDPWGLQSLTGDPGMDRSLEPELHGALNTYAPCLDYSKGAGDLLNVFGDSLTDPDKYEEVLEQIGTPMLLAVSAALHFAEGEWEEGFKDIGWMAAGLIGRGGVGKPSTGPISHITPPSGAAGPGLAKAAQTGTKLGTTLADEMGILREAARGTGNYSLGSATNADAMRLGKAWVGEGFIVASDGKTLLSADRLRQFRPPAPKLSSFATTGVQANFERRAIPSGPYGGNGHLNIIP